MTDAADHWFAPYRPPSKLPPLPRRPKTAQVPGRQAKAASTGSQPVTPETGRTPRAVSSMSYKIHKQASAEDTNADTAMFTMPKIGGKLGLVLVRF